MIMYLILKVFVFLLIGIFLLVRKDGIIKIYFKDHVIIHVVRNKECKMIDD